MSDCWKILGLKPTTDLAAIKRAYRAKVKRYHPDTVTTPEQKRRYTIICAAINDAYREAVRQAQTPPAAPPVDDHEPFADQPYQDDEGEPAQGYRDFDFTTFARHSNAVATFFRARNTWRGMLWFFFGVTLFAFFVGNIQAPAIVVTLTGVVVALFFGAFIFGLLTAGVMDLIIFWLFPRRLLRELGLAKYESKLVWVTILAANAVLFFFTRIIGHPVSYDISTIIVDVTIRATATVTVPGILALFWMRDLAYYRRIKRDGRAHIGSL